MGCTKSTPQDQSFRRSSVPLPFINKFEEMLSISHPLNINNKYTYILQILPNQTTGQGIFKTPAYNCLTTKNELIKKRKQFWQTRTTGKQQLWNSIKQAIQTPDQKQARNIISHSGLVLVKDSLQMTLDNKLMRYEVPIHCLNDPVRYSEEDLAHRNLNQSFTPEDIRVTIRNTKRQDVQIETNTDVSVKQLKIKYLNGVSGKKVRLFWKGRQLIDDSKLGHYKIENNSIIQCLLI